VLASTEQSFGQGSFNDQGSITTSHHFPLPQIRFGVVFYWTDERLAGYEGFSLPSTLWGPELFVKNRLGELERDFEQVGSSSDR